MTARTVFRNEARLLAADRVLIAALTLFAALLACLRVTSRNGELWTVLE